MGSFVRERTIAAPVERVFALSLDVGVHVDSMAAHDERIAAGTRSGRMAEGDTVTWDARHFGIRFRMTSLVFDVDEPHAFSDRQIRGPCQAHVGHVRGAEVDLGGRARALTDHHVEFASQ